MKTITVKSRIGEKRTRDGKPRKVAVKDVPMPETLTETELKTLGGAIRKRHAALPEHIRTHLDLDDLLSFVDHFVDGYKLAWQRGLGKYQAEKYGKEVEAAAQAEDVADESV